jgi:hypothetical protein
MLSFLRDSRKPGDRKLRLFACVCVRRVWHLLARHNSKRAVEVAERYADGLTNSQARARAKAAAEQAVDELKGMRWNAAVAAMMTLAKQVRVSTVAEGIPHDPYRPSEGEAKNREQAQVLRDIFGPLPFRPPPPLAPSLLTWRDGLILRLAQAAYDNRLLPSGHLDQARLAVLADALEDAGCQDAEILEHLRGEGPHVRGCWCVDLVLCKE